MKNLISIKKLTAFFALTLLAFTVVSCNRDNDFDADDFPQEEITNIIVKLTNSAGVAQDYNYNVSAGGAPVMKLMDGETYIVDLKFMNGAEDVTSEISAAKDEHFIVFDFPRSEVNLDRMDAASSNGQRVGLKTKWTVIKTVGNSSPFVTLRLVHDAQATNEAKNGTAWGSTEGGETDVEATFGLTN